MQINSKAEFFRLWEAGVLGNRLQIWRDEYEARHACFTQLIDVVGFREIKLGAGSLAIVDRRDIFSTAIEWRKLNRNFMICQSAPDHLATVQGEVYRTVGGWRGFIAAPVLNGQRMRESLRSNARDCRGVEITELLDRYMDQNSRDDLEQLDELYPEHVVEFTCYSVELGQLPHRNTIFWEVRNY